MNEWIDAVKKELGLTISCDVDTILDIARDAAHTIERPAAPVTTFLLGVAVAQGATQQEAAEKISALAKGWPTKE